MLDQKKHYMSWPVIALLDFVTIISFENIFYPFKIKDYLLLFHGFSYFLLMLFLMH